MMTKQRKTYYSKDDAEEELRDEHADKDKEEEKDMKKRYTEIWIIPFFKKCTPKCSLFLNNVYVRPQKYL